MNMTEEDKRCNVRVAQMAAWRAEHESEWRRPPKERSLADRIWDMQIACMYESNNAVCRALLASAHNERLCASQEFWDAIYEMQLMFWKALYVQDDPEPEPFIVAPSSPMK